MVRHSSASLRQQSPTSRKPKLKIIDPDLKRRARLLINNTRIPGQTRNLILYALEIKDPYLPQIVRRVEAGEMFIEHLHHD